MVSNTRSGERPQQVQQNESPGQSFRDERLQNVWANRLAQAQDEGTSGENLFLDAFIQFMQQTDTNIAQLKQQQEQQFAQLKQQQEQQFAQLTQQQEQQFAQSQAHINQSILHLAHLMQNFPCGTPGANYVQASNPRVEFHKPSEAFNYSRGAFEPHMNSSSPGANQLNLDPASSTEHGQ